MTMPAPDLSFLIPKKWKATVALIGSALSFAVPYVLTYTDSLPQPWPGAIGFALFVATALGVYHAPYAPSGAVLVTADDAAKITQAEVYPNPYPKPWA